MEEIEILNNGIFSYLLRLESPLGVTIDGIVLGSTKYRLRKSNSNKVDAITQSLLTMTLSSWITTTFKASITTLSRR